MSIHSEVEKLKQQIEEEQKEKLKIALFGQPGAGKSSIINRLVGSNVAKVGQKTDVTVEAQIIEWNNLLLVDLPGYGTTKFPKNEYFETFNVDDFNIYLCVFSGKFHAADTEFFHQLRNKGRVCIFVRNHHDEIWEDGRSIEDLEKEIIDDVQKQVQSNESVVFTSCRNKKGFDELSNMIEVNIDDANKEKWVKSAKAYSVEFLEKKKKKCMKHVITYAGLSAANGINPIIGADIAVDVGILVKLFKKIRESYGLTNEQFELKKQVVQNMAPVVNNVIKYGTKEGVSLLLKRFAVGETLKETTKYVPIVGQLIAATLGFSITIAAAHSYLNDCHAVAKTILESELTC